MPKSKVLIFSLGAFNSRGRNKTYTAHGLEKVIQKGKYLGFPQEMSEYTEIERTLIIPLL
jgi:hypothetical protein